MGTPLDPPQLCAPPPLCRTPAFHNFVKVTLTKNPKKRPSATKMLSVRTNPPPK